MNKSSKTKNKSICIKVNPTTETVDTQYELEKKRLVKKRDLRSKQNHEYRIMFYGTPKEKEEVRQKHRQALLDQVKSKEIGLKEQYNSKIAENEESFSCQSSLKSEQPTPPTYSKEQYLKQFRDQNKFLMEKRASDHQVKRNEENQKEKELLKYDPINWSKTLV